MPFDQNNRPEIAVADERDYREMAEYLDEMDADFDDDDDFFDDEEEGDELYEDYAYDDDGRYDDDPSPYG